MDNTDFLNYLNSGKEVICCSDIHKHMTMLSQEAIKITTEINSAYHDSAEIRRLYFPN